MLDPATAKDLDDAPRVRTKQLTYNPQRRGTGLLYVDECCYAEDGTDRLVELDLVTRAERVLRSAQRFRHVAVAPHERDVLYVTATSGTAIGRLYRWDFAGEPVDLGAATALAYAW